jgi:hypothetical protein
MSLFFIRKDKIWLPGCPKRLCQMEDDNGAKVDECVTLLVEWGTVMG